MLLSFTFSTLLLIIAVIALALASAALLRLRKLERKIQSFLTGKSGKSLEDVLIHHGETLRKHQREIEDVRKASEYLHRAVQSSLRKVAFERYNPFPSVGGNQSFTLVLLDAHNSGVAITSLHSRESTRVYAKAIREGQPLQNLSEEEERVLKNALMMRGA